MEQKIQELSSRFPKQIEHIQTEEATKTAFVMPFLQALGYDVFNPREVVPEFTSDMGTKKGEKVDYAIVLENTPMILIECKQCGTNLNEIDPTQLYRYFSTQPSRIGILTNGLTYRFFSDLDEPNKMDQKPFFEFNILNYDDFAIRELKKFSKSAFSIEDIIPAASELKYTKEIKRLLSEELQDPSDDFIRFFTAQVYSGRTTQTVKERFSGIVKKAFNQFVSDKVSDRLKSALAEEASLREDHASTEESPIEDPGQQIITTQEEIAGFEIVRAMIRDVVDTNRVVMRDTLSYCGIILDDSNRKPICRLYFNNPNKMRIGIFTAPKEEERFDLACLSDIPLHADLLRKAVGVYDE